MLTAIPAEGYQFEAWLGVDNANGGTATVTMNSDRAVTVEFVAVEEPKRPVPNMCGACGAGTATMMSMSLCVLGFARFRRRWRG